MKRFLTIVSLTVSILTGLAVVGLAAGPATVADDFESGSYSGSQIDGDGSWSGPWVEVGESDGPSSGDVRVATLPGCPGRCLVVSGALIVSSSGATRTAVVSGPHMVEAAYTVVFRGLAAASVRVQANVDGAGWGTIATRSTSGTFSHALGVSSGSVAIRFVVDGLSIGGSIGIDDVSLTFSPVPVSTTTTTIVNTTLTTVTSPPLTTTTSPTITLPGDSTTTTLGASTTTTRPLDAPTTDTTTTTRPTSDSREDDAVVPPPIDGGSGPTPTQPQVTPVRSDGVVLSLDPRLSPRVAAGQGPLDVLDAFLVRFGLGAEDLNLDLTLYLLLGAMLAIVSAMKFERGFRRQNRSAE